MALTITSNNFTEEVEQSDKVVLIDFWAEWCPPCKMIAPLIDELAEEYKDQVKIVKVDVDEAKDLAEKFHISSIPTLLVIKNNEVVNQAVGALPKPAIVELFSSHL